MEASKIYLRAAKYVAADIDPVCCMALNRAAFKSINRGFIKDKFHYMFQPDGADMCTAYFGPINKHNREARILALLLMHEIEVDSEL